MKKEIPRGSGFNRFGDLIGLELGDADAGRSLCRLTLTPDLMNPHGVVHGAIVYALVDTGMGLALYPTLEEHESCATVEIKLSHLRPASDGVLTCETQLIHRGRHIAVLESEVRNGAQLIAKALGTYAIFTPRQPA